MIDHILIPKIIIQSDVGSLVKIQVEWKYESTLAIVGYISVWDGSLWIGHGFDNVALPYVQTMANSLNIIKILKKKDSSIECRSST